MTIKGGACAAIHLFNNSSKCKAHTDHRQDLVSALLKSQGIKAVALPRYTLDMNWFLQT